MQLVRGRIKVVENPAPKRWLLVQGLSEELLRGENDSKQSDEFQARGGGEGFLLKEFSFLFILGELNKQTE